MDHYQIKSGKEFLEFSHYLQKYPKGWWSKDNPISIDNYKINIFVSGDFSVFSGNNRFEPKSGDVFIVEPAEMHCGNIAKETFIEYYQLDFGKNAFSSLPGGNNLLQRIIELKRAKGPFIRTSTETAGKLQGLCNEIEKNIDGGEILLAFVKAAELICDVKEAFESGSSASFSGFSKAVSKAISHIEESPADELSVAGVADFCKVSETYLLKVFKKELGETVSSYIMRHKLLVAVSMLSGGVMVSKAASECGFSDSSHFISCFKKYFGCTPNEYKKLRRF